MLKSSEKTSASAAQPPAGARRGARRAGTENFHQHQGGPAVEGKMMSYFAKEVQLTKKHEEILAQRLLLLQEMENDHGNQKTGKKTSHVKAAKLAQKRNRSLLQDIRTLEKRFEKEAHSRPPPELTNLQVRRGEAAGRAGGPRSVRTGALQALTQPVVDFLCCVIELCGLVPQRQEPDLR
ncbi:uncharacterized protein C3orf14 homolog isoform X1 [Monodelphis domestica]|uniref:uncharacterized protein C3orf14 homolog isoform X1 n=1 Tax=Monodelphis domestica TaxID=13616 RepID=UPI0024E25ED4|nr:uncharacterized protein C3orf14 homolog isoform X1 [Monodelphis domestica]